MLLRTTHQENKEFIIPLTLHHHWYYRVVVGVVSARIFILHTTTTGVFHPKPEQLNISQQWPKIYGISVRSIMRTKEFLECPLNVRLFFLSSNSIYLACDTWYLISARVSAYRPSYTLHFTGLIWWRLSSINHRESQHTPLTNLSGWPLDGNVWFFFANQLWLLTFIGIRPDRSDSMWSAKKRFCLTDRPKQ